MHNVADPTVPFEQALATHNNLTALGVTTHELITVPGRDHTPNPFQTPGTSRCFVRVVSDGANELTGTTTTLWQDMVEFMARHTAVTGLANDTAAEAEEDDEFFFVVPTPTSSSTSIFKTTTAATALVAACLSATAWRQLAPRSLGATQ